MREDEVTEEVNLKNKVAYIACVSDSTVSTAAETEDDDESAQYSDAGDPQSLADVSAALKRLGLMHSYYKSALHTSQTEIRLLEQLLLRQTTILDHFQFH